ncbi:hypothetical protein CIB95_03005 [Lottiidibacillus patelloidae]|uniref:DUF2500 domain-containing protein n=1 Tax=Lottiidibacillus patelloidae TaxID=2670334 RepID=A0A263BYA5_9BACI|nr:DUF2500 domain-containing protein [Lottiidibacillus patelloidae]OZM58552.1 hypothetical protein CIB95_03005 [Lottiidibacillus patelloidae]
MFEDSSTDFMFTFGPIFIATIFFIVISVFIIIIITGIMQWTKNNKAPKLNVNAKIITKRTAVKGGGESRAYTKYYVTFEMESGDRMELQVKGNDFGVLAEGDEGELYFQGTRYLGFDRTRIKEL